VFVSSSMQETTQVFGIESEENILLSESFVWLSDILLIDASSSISSISCVSRAMLLVLLVLLRVKLKKFCDVM